MSDVDPMVKAPFKIARRDRIASAGSCFAQHLARRLSAARYQYMLVEPGYERMGRTLSTKFNYGTFSARYGNIYTARQLLQLFERAYGGFIPDEGMWRNGTHWVDPFRPLIQPFGFESLREAQLDQTQHLAAVRKLLETVDVFIFTLGLTEAWLCKSDGAVLPVCPGCSVGVFNPDKYEFKNFEVDEIVADMTEFIGKLLRVNPNARIVLTVSPIPLVATFTESHVLTATTYSKSVLRVAAERIARSAENCAYFPSYEIISGSFNRGQYFAENLRDVTEDGIDHVMRVFFRHFGEDASDSADIESQNGVTATPMDRSRSVLDVICEEYASLNAGTHAR